jgi:hypothetical protein
MSKDTVSQLEVNLNAKDSQLSKAQVNLQVTEKQLSRTKTDLDKAMKELTTDVLKEYAEATVKLNFQIAENRLLLPYKDRKSWYLPVIQLGSKSYIIGDFSKVLGLSGNWTIHKDIYKLEYSISDPSSKETEGMQLRKPILSLDIDKSVVLLPVPANREALKPISFEQLKKRGLHSIHLFKSDSYGKRSTNLGNRCSISLVRGDNYLYINNDPRNRTSEINAEIGDILLTREGRFVGIVVDIVSSSMGKKEEAKCFVFPEKINLSRSLKIPLEKPEGQKYYKDFAHTVYNLQKELKKKRSD